MEGERERQSVGGVEGEREREGGGEERGGGGERGEGVLARSYPACLKVTF